MPKKLMAWQCNFCTKRLDEEKRIEKHEAICPSNPETRACATCALHSCDFDFYYGSIHSCGGDNIASTQTNCPKWEKKGPK